MIKTDTGWVQKGFAVIATNPKTRTPFLHTFELTESEAKASLWIIKGLPEQLKLSLKIVPAEIHFDVQGHVTAQ